MIKITNMPHLSFRRKTSYAFLCHVWHISFLFENLTDLERVKKNALKIILRGDYVSYEHVLERVYLECLVERGDKLCLKFAKACLKNENVK